MSRYRYEAADAQGRISRGQLEADSPTAVIGQLRGLGLSALQVEPEPAASAGGGLFASKLSDADLAWTTRQLASLLSARLPIERQHQLTVGDGQCFAGGAGHRRVRVDLEFQHAARQVDRARQVALRVLSRFAHIDQDAVVLRRQLVGRDLFDTAACLGHQILDGACHGCLQYIS